MASTASQNNAFELMTTGEKSGQWGDITNVNMQIIDRATKGVGTITLSSTSYSLNTIDYTLSEGQYAVLVFAGTPGGTCTVTINPNDQQKVFIVRNTTANSVVLTQGSGGNVTVAAGNTGIVYADGAGTGAAVVDVTRAFTGNLAPVSALEIDCSQSTYFTKTISTNSTFTFANAPSGRAYGFILRLTLVGAPTQTWPASVLWPSGLVPTIASGKTALFVFATEDGGTTWRGAALVDYAS